MTDRRLVFGLGAALFALSAWPLLLVEVPPLQDLPNHLATMTVLEHAQLYPELHVNGLLKTNSALYAWLHLVGRVTPLFVAAKMFVALTLAVTAWTLPAFVLRLGGRERVVVAALVLWPAVHNWFVSAGMLNFALAVPMALGVLLLLADGRRAWAGVLALATWYAHVFPLLVVLLLVAIDALEGPGSARARVRGALANALVLAPATTLSAVSLATQAREGSAAMSGFVTHHAELLNVDLVYNAWAEFAWGFTRLSATTLVPTVVLAVWAARGFRARPRFFGPWAMGALLLAYALLPYMATNWFYLNSRMMPFLWAGALLRVPASLDRRARGALVACAALASVGMGMDYARLEADRREVTAGIDAVPAGARLLPLVFRSKGRSENTRALLHAWGFYVVAKHTSAPLLFAHSAAFPVMYAAPPPPRWNHLVLENFAPSMAEPEWTCGRMREMGIAEDCEAAWRMRWAIFRDDAAGRFDHLLLWEAPSEVKALLAPAFEPVFARGRLDVYRRRDQGASTR